MLVLTREKGEILFIDNEITGERITIQITDIKGNRVRIGIDATQDWKIFRQELLCPHLKRSGMSQE